MFGKSEDLPKPSPSPYVKQWRNKTSKVFCFLFYPYIESALKEFRKAPKSCFPGESLSEVANKSWHPTQPHWIPVQPHSRRGKFRDGLPTPTPLFSLGSLFDCQAASMPQVLSGISMTQVYLWRSQNHLVETQRSQSLSPFSPWITPTCTYYGKTPFLKVPTDNDSAVHIIHTYYFSIYSGIQLLKDRAPKGFLWI